MRAMADELRRLADAAALAAKNGIEVHAGHGLTYDNVGPDRRDPAGRASSTSGISSSARRCSWGSATAVRRMREAMDAARG